MFRGEGDTKGGRVVGGVRGEKREGEGSRGSLGEGETGVFRGRGGGECA